MGCRQIEARRTLRFFALPCFGRAGAGGGRIEERLLVFVVVVLFNKNVRCEGGGTKQHINFAKTECWAYMNANAIAYFVV